MSRIHMEYWKNNDLGDEETADEISIKAYIEQAVNRDYSPVLKFDGRWSTFFHLSEMRESILNWYEFKDNADLLEIGGGMGGLTGLLSRRCAHVTTVESSRLCGEAIYSRYHDIDNLDIYVGELSDIDFKKKFDYITVIGGLELQGNYSNSNNPYVDFLKDLTELLKPDGKLLLAVENRFGIKYWCGYKEQNTGIPFDGINGYPFGGATCTFGKKELEKLLVSSGLDNYKFYYPLPDYKVPQIIYSEKYLPEIGLKSRMIPYYVDNSTLLASEMDLYDDIIDNNVFEFFSNSFLIEAGHDTDFCSVIYAAVTTDRPVTDRFCTTIHENDVVKKTPLDSKGYQSIVNIYNNLMEIKSRDLQIVPHQIEKNKLIMPRMECQTLEGYLKIVLKKDKDLFVSIFDEFYNCILKSSDIVTNTNSYLENKYPSVNFGPILKKTYIDLIPNNCFYDEGNFVFFDQEFVWDNFPAKFILFRALKYTFSFNASDNSIVSIEEMKIRYGLESLWDIFEEEDLKFVKNNRSYSLYKNFLLWSYVDKNNIHRNIHRLIRSEFANVLINKGFNKIAIYGFGHNGTQLYQELKNSGVTVGYVIDQNADCIIKERYLEVPIVHPDDYFAPVDAIVVSLKNNYESIKEMLSLKVDVPVIPLD
jgi:SAM-dependent methyltransferase